MTLAANRNFSRPMCFYSLSMEVMKMLKKSLAALFGLVFAMALITPPKANAEVVIGVGLGHRPVYGYVAARPYVRPYAYVAPAYVAPAPYVAYPGYVEPGYAYAPYVYPGRVVIGRGYRYEARRGNWRR
jgi:hypothetical protein